MTKWCSVLLNQFWSNEGKVVVSFIFLRNIIHLSVHHSLKHNVIINFGEIIFQYLFAELFSLLFKSLNWCNLIQKVFLLFSFGVMVILVFRHLFSHLFQVFLHNLIIGELKLIIDFFTETYHFLQWISIFVIMTITQLLNSLKFDRDVLWIWIGHVMAFSTLGGSILSESSCFDRWSQHREVFDFDTSACSDGLVSTCITSGISWILFFLWRKRFVHVVLVISKRPPR